MKKNLVRILILLLCAVMVLGLAMPAFAAGGNVTYDGDSQKFIFAPGSNESVTDLFPDFRGVMPGDSLTETVTVKNDASNEVKVKIYMRALGAVENAAFLNQLKLTVKQDGDSILFNAPADQKAGLTDWVCLGTFYSGAEIDLLVTLNVPIEMSNEYQNQEGRFQWEFKVEEYPIEPSDPEIPETGDEINLMLLISLMGISFAGIIFFLFLLMKKRKEEEEAETA